MGAQRGIVIVGAGLAGLRTVENLRREGYAGPLALIGAEADKPYDRPPLSKQVLRGERGVVLLRGDDYAALNIDLRLGVSATGLDTAAKAVRLDDGTELAYHQLVIATGAHPRTLPDQPTARGVQVLRTARDCLRLKDDLASARQLVIVGGGFIGCEVAASARTMGIAVTLLEVLDRPLVRVLGEPVAAVVQRLHEDHGVVVRTGVGVASVLASTAPSGAGSVCGVRLSSGEQVAADVVLVGLGVAPETGWLAGSGVSVDNGVLCDRYGETVVPGVFAAGDVARFTTPAGERRRVEHWTNASDMALTVARNLLRDKGNREPYDPVPYVWSDQYDVRIQAVGFFAPDDEITVHTVGPKARTVALYQRAGKLTGAVGLSAPRQVMELRAVLAAGGSVADARDVLA